MLFSFDTERMLSSDKFGILKIEGKTYYGELARERSAPQGLGVWVYSDGSYFKGEWADGKRQGKGIFHRANGEEYRGDFVNDKMDGAGTYFWPNGNWYKGDINDGQLTGKGVRYLSKTRCYYNGTFENGQFIGKFIAYDANGSFYEIECDKIVNVEEKKHLPVSSKRVSQLMRAGYGTKIDIQQPNKNGFNEVKFNDGSIYRGNFLDGDLFGYGIYIQKDGTKFEGEWLFGKRCGRGKLTRPDGFSIDSTWDGDKFGGRTVYCWPNGDKCEVQDVGDISYKGKKIFANGDTFVGEMKNGLAYGRGVYNFSNGDVYKGSFEADRLEGKGIMSFADGNKYAGDFERGQMYGIGIFQYANGDRFEGEFYNGLPQKDKGVFIKKGEEPKKRTVQYSKVPLSSVVDNVVNTVRVGFGYVQLESKEYEITFRDAKSPEEYYVEIEYYKGDKKKSTAKFDGAGENVGRCLIERVEFNSKNAVIYCAGDKKFHIFGQNGRDIKVTAKKISECK